MAQHAQPGSAPDREIAIQETANFTLQRHSHLVRAFVVDDLRLDDRVDEIQPASEKRGLEAGKAHIAARVVAANSSNTAGTECHRIALRHVDGSEPKRREDVFSHAQKYDIPRRKSGHSHISRADSLHSTRLWSGFDTHK